MTEQELRRNERLVRWPSSVIAILVLGGALVLGHIWGPVSGVKPDFDVTAAPPSLPALFLAPVALVVAFELALGLLVAIASGRALSPWKPIERHAEHLASQPSSEVVPQLLARITEVGLDGSVERGAGTTEIRVRRASSHAFGEFEGLPLRGSISVEDVVGACRVQARVSVDTFIVRDTGEGDYLQQLATYLSGQSQPRLRVRHPGAALSIGVHFAMLALILAATAARIGSPACVAFAAVSGAFGAVTAALTCVAIGIRYRGSYGLPEALAALAANVWILRTLDAWRG